MNRYLVCEGPPDSLDARILNELVVQQNDLDVQIHAAGGGKGLGAVRLYLESRDKSSVVVTVEDRDFQASEKCASTWSNSNPRNLMWQRHEIENYLLDSRIFLAFVEELGLQPRVQWKSIPPQSIEEIETIFEQIGRDLLEDHASSLFWRDIQLRLNGFGNTSFAVARPTAALGQSAPGKEEWWQAISSFATTFRTSCQNCSAAPELDPSNLKSQFDAKLEEMAASDMIMSGRYLVEFAGKEFFSALAARLSNYLRGKQFSGKELADELWEQLRRLYKPNGFYVTDEFAELATILKNHSR